MASKWAVRALEDCMAAIIDYRGKTPQKTSSGIPLITAKIVKGGRIEKPNEYIAPEDYGAWMRRGIPKAGDVLLTTEAPLGETAQLQSGRVALAQRIIVLRGKSDVLDNTFLKFLMQSEAVQDQLRARASGTTVLGIKQRELRRILLTLPPLHEQHAIAHILGTLDDKIELSRRMNETLEAIARAIFKSWFVGFDPIIDNALRAGNPIPSPLAEKAARRREMLARAKSEGRESCFTKYIADLFPDRFVDSELGPIPAEWRVGTLGDFAEHPRRGIRPEELFASTPYIALKHMPKHCIALSEWGVATAIESSKFEFKQGEILFGKLRPYFHKVGVAPVDGVCSTDILVIRPKQETWFGFVLGHISSNALVDYSNAGATGTKMPRTCWRDISRYALVVPAESAIVQFNHIIRPVVERIITGIHESHAFTAFRDSLIPKLLTGELSIGVVERGV